MATNKKSGSKKGKPANSSPVAQTGAATTPVPYPAVSAPSKLSWKDHPAYVLGGVVVATATATAGVMNYVVIPARDVEARAKFEKLEAVNVQLRTTLGSKDSELLALRNDLKQSKELSDALHLELRTALTAQLFSPNDPYPNGLRSVRIGESVTSISRAYPKATVDKSKDGVWSLQRFHPTFTDVHYFFDLEDQKKIITHIRFDVEDTNPREFLRRKLRDALGPPRNGPKPEQFGWIRGGSAGVFHWEPYSYFVMTEGAEPRWWKGSKP